MKRLMLIVVVMMVVMMVVGCGDPGGFSDNEKVTQDAKEEGTENKVIIKRKNHRGEFRKVEDSASDKGIKNMVRSKPKNYGLERHRVLRDSEDPKVVYSVPEVIEIGSLNSYGDKGVGALYNLDLNQPLEVVTVLIKKENGKPVKIFVLDDNFSYPKRLSFDQVVTWPEGLIKENEAKITAAMIFLAQWQSLQPGDRVVAEEKIIMESEYRDGGDIISIMFHKLPQTEK